MTSASASAAVSGGEFPTICDGLGSQLRAVSTSLGTEGPAPTGTRSSWSHGTFVALSPRKGKE